MNDIQYQYPRITGQHCVLWAKYNNKGAFTHKLLLFPFRKIEQKKKKHYKVFHFARNDINTQGNSLQVFSMII